MSKRQLSPAEQQDHAEMRAKLVPAAILIAGGLSVGGLLAASHADGNHQKQHTTVVNELEQPAHTVSRELKDGRIDSKLVVEARVPENGAVSNVAADMAASTEDPMELSEIMSAQTQRNQNSAVNNQVFKGETFEVPRGSVVPEDVVGPVKNQTSAS